MPESFPSNIHACKRFFLETWKFQAPSMKTIHKSSKQLRKNSKHTMLLEKNFWKFPKKNSRNVENENIEDMRVLSMKES